MINLAIVVLVTLLISWILTGYLIKALPKLKAVAVPNTRSNHQKIIPTGGGIAIMLSIVIGSYLLNEISPISQVNSVIILALPLAIISFLDDIYHMSVLLRLITQIAVVTLSLSFLPKDMLIWQGLLPPVLDKLFSGLIFIWFINAYNFMDGIDGLAGSETIHIALSVALVIYLTAATSLYEIANFLFILAAASLGFIWWNWHPAKIFMGDTGSIPLGFMLGWVLLLLASHGLWVVSLIIPMYYCLDSGLTICKRLMQRKKIWQAHSEHFYQIAVRSGLSHAQVTKTIIVTNLLLMLTSLLAIYYYTYIAIILSVIIVAILLKFLKRAPVAK